MAEKEYIERDALLKQMRDYYGCSVECDMECPVTECGEGRIIMITPAADVAEVVHGEWEDKYHIVPLYGDKQMRGTFKTCSVCRFIVVGESLGPLNYCPDCGARMDGGKRKENHGE